MTDTAIKELLQKQGEAHHEFKTTVNEALKAAQLDQAEVKSKLEKLNGELDRLGKEIDTQAKRLQAAADAAKESGDFGKELKTFNGHRAAVATSGKRYEGDLTGDQYAAYKKQFENFLRGGVERMEPDQAKTMFAGSDPNGGYLVTPDLSGRLVQKIFETSPMRQHASVQVIGTDALEGTKDLEEGSAGWVGERESRPATNTPTTGTWRIPVHELYAMPEATQRLLDDASVDVEAWLSGKVSRKMARMEGAAFVNGNGVNQPRGLLTYTTAATADAARAWEQFQHIATGGATFGTAPNGVEKLLDVVHSMYPQYLANAKWAMNRLTLAEVRKLKDAEGNFLWLPSMEANKPSTLLGYGILDFPDFPNIGADALAIGFGDLGETYQIVDRAGITVIRDNLTNKPYVRFYTSKRVGGAAIQFESYKFLKFSA